MKIGSLTLFVVMLLAVERSVAQQIELEVFIRPALTSLYGNQTIKKNLNPALYPSGGLGISTHIGTNSLLNLGLLYDEKGGRKKMTYDFRDANNVTTRTVTLTQLVNYNYITLPIQWQYRFGKKIQYQLGIGAYGAYLLKAENGLKGARIADDQKESITSSSRRVDAGLSSSFSVYIPIKNTWALKLGIDENLGMINENKHGGAVKTSSLGMQIGLRYSFVKDRS